MIRTKIPEATGSSYNEAVLACLTLLTVTVLWPAAPYHRISHARGNGVVEVACYVSTLG